MAWLIALIAAFVLATLLLWVLMAKAVCEELDEEEEEKRMAEIAKRNKEGQHGD